MKPIRSAHSFRIVAHDTRVLSSLFVMVIVGATAAYQGTSTPWRIDTPPSGAMTVQVREVTFSGADLITIVADPGTPTYPDPPQWVAKPENRALPIGYPRNTDCVVSARFRVHGANATFRESESNMKVRGSSILSATQPFHFTIQSTTVRLEGNDVVLPPTTVVNPFPDTVNYGTLVLNWEFSTDGGVSWSRAGRTENELYVTLAKPSTNRVYHTLLHLSVPISAKIHAADDATLIAQTWKNFETNKVTAKHILPKFDERKLHFYNDWFTGSNDCNMLLLSHDGNAYAWSTLFAGVLKAAGVKTTMQLAQFRSVGVHQSFGYAGKVRERMLINKWKFADNGGSSGNTTWPYQNERNLKFDSFTVGDASGYFWRTDNDECAYFWSQNAEVRDEVGTAGQNTENPLSIFYEHVLIKIHDTYYDPSYGKKYASRQQWEDQAVAGFLVHDPSGIKYYIRRNPTGKDVPPDTEEVLFIYTEQSGVIEAP